MGHKKEHESDQSTTKKIVGRALAEAAFRKRLLEHPSAAVSEVVGDKRKVHMSDAQRRSLAEILEKALSDEGFRRQLLENPEAAVTSMCIELPPHPPDLPGGDARYFCFMSFIYVGNPD